MIDEARLGCTYDTRTSFDLLMRWEDDTYVARLIDSDSSLIMSRPLDTQSTIAMRIYREEGTSIIRYTQLSSVQRNLHRPPNLESEIRLLFHAVHANHACDALPYTSAHGLETCS